MNKHILEPAAQQLADATANRRSSTSSGRRRPQGPRRHPGGADRQARRRREVDHRPGRGRRRPGAHRQAGRCDRHRCRAILYVHGGGWVLGNAGTHDRLVRELAVGADAAVVFVEYDRSPEAQYPVAIEQAYATAQWITRDGADRRASTRRAWPSPATPSAATWPPPWRSSPSSAATSRSSTSRCTTRSPTPRRTPTATASSPTARSCTAKAMAWFWDCYLPDRGASAPRSPPRRCGRALDELAGLPEAFLIVDENDVLRDEGEAYARKLTEAGVRTTQRALQRHHPRLHDAQPAPRDRRRDRRDRAGDPRPPQGAARGTHVTERTPRA